MVLKYSASKPATSLLELRISVEVFTHQHKLCNSFLYRFFVVFNLDR